MLMDAQPNVLLIVLDTVRASSLSCYGHETPTTPNIDAFADQATRYECAISEGCWTVPSHASLFTGQGSPDHGSHAHNRQFTPGDAPVLAEKLSKIGYETYGASRNAWITEERGFGRGFSEFDDRDHAQLFEETFDIRNAIRHHAGSKTFQRYAGIFADAMTSGHPLKAMANLAYFAYRDSRYCDDGANVNNNFAETVFNSGEEPWFLFLNYMEAHEPYYEKHDHNDRFIPEEIPPFSAYDESAKWDFHAGRTNPPFEELKSLYEADIRLLDERIGELFDTLDKYNSTDETLIVVLGDHGQHFGEHDLMAHIASPYPGAIRVPLLVSEPGQTAGRVASDPVSIRMIYDLILDHTTDQETKHAGDCVISHCFGSHEDVFDNYPELDENAWREHLATAVVQLDNEYYGIVRGDRGRHEIYNVTDQTGTEPDIIIDEEEVISRLDTDLDSMANSRTKDAAEDVSGRLKDLGYI
jgi:arylsulfatase A-like enzyme